MKLAPKHNDDDLEVDMSPMIDMVFLLLILFAAVKFGFNKLKKNRMDS